jgi:serine protease AprX
MNKKLLFALALISGLIFSDALYSQKYWVMFKNKNGTPYTLSAGTGYLSVKSIQRRINQGIPMDNTDLPVTPSYVSQVDAVPGVTIVYRSKWLNGIVVSISTSTATALASINSFTFVQTTNRVNRYQVTFPPIQTSTSTATNEDRTQSPSAYNYGSSLNQAQMIGADCLHSMGYRGQGMTIAVLDAGFTDVQKFDIFDSLFMQGRLLGTRDFVDGFGDTTVFTEHTHGAECLSTMAGIKSGSIIGTAPKASYWLLRTEDGATETLSEEYNWIRGVEFADSVGADVTSTSLGYTTFDPGAPSANDHTYSMLNGKTAPMTIAATMAARKGMLVLNAAGNEGCSSPSSCWYYISVPSDADSIIAVGAVDPGGTKAGFSSFGPTADGRIKPDLMSQGGPALVCLFGSGCFMGSGTSFATPILAGAVTCLWQSKKPATNMQIIAALKATADSTANPNNRIGWGIPHMCAARTNSILSSVGISEYSNDHNIRIYPNPFSGELNIWINDLPSQNIHVNITNVLGQTLYDQTITGPSGGVIHLNEVAECKPGIYFVNLSAGGINIVKKVMKQ